MEKRASPLQTGRGQSHQMTHLFHSPACRAVRENPAEAERQLAEPLEQLETLEDALLALEMDNAEHLQGLLQVRRQSWCQQAGLCREAGARAGHGPVWATSATAGRPVFESSTLF